MLILVQLLVKTPPAILSRIFSPRCVVLAQEAAPQFEIADGDLLRRTLSTYFSSINIHHRVSVYESNGPPRIIFLRLFDQFPEGEISSLVCILSTEEVTPPLPLPDPQPYTILGDM